jgi:hypothetical protein
MTGRFWGDHRGSCDERTQKVYFVNYTPEMEEARSRGGLRANSFVCLQKPEVADALMLDVNDLGDAEAPLSNPRHFGGAARQLLKRGIIPTEDGWGGWLGRYQTALCWAARKIEERRERNLVRRWERTHSPVPPFSVPL